jgi:hypothetical protein
VHDALLAAAGSTWFDTRPFDPAALPPGALASRIAGMAAALRGSYGTAPHFVLKDPRCCRFLPLLRGVLAGLGCRIGVVLALRDPTEVAASLAARNRLSPAYAGILWARHAIEAERDSRDLPRAVVAYAGLLADWRGAAARILALPGDWRPAEEAASPLQPGLRHHRGQPPEQVFGAPLAALLGALDQALGDLGVRDDAAARARVDAAAAPVLAAARRMATTLEAEFLFQRMTSPNPLIASPDPVADAERFAAVMQRLHPAPLEMPDAPPPPSFDPVGSPETAALDGAA